jgi:hypothetical protein
VTQPTHNETIYVLDRITPKPGRGAEFLEFYLERYAPNARERGMTLVHRWVAPPMWLTDASNTLYLIWSVAGAPTWWRTVSAGKRDPGVEAFWREAGSMIESRHRSMLADVDDFASLADV